MKTPDRFAKEAYDQFATAFGIVSGLSLREEEGYFSRQRCECCKDPLGGTRYEVSCWSEKNKEVMEFSACPDCVYYSTYGDLGGREEE